MSTTQANALQQLIADGKVRPGDVLCFRGHAWISRAIQDFTHQLETHVGIIIRSADGQLYFAESGPAVVRDVIENDMPFGVGIYPLLPRIAAEDGDVILCRLANPLTETQSQTLTANALQMDKTEVPYNVWELVQMGFWYQIGQHLGQKPPQPFGRGMVCSVFVTDMLDRVDAVNCNPYGQAPGDVYRWSIWSERLPLQ